MNRSWQITLLLLLSSAPCLFGQAAPEGTPERALQDLAFATKPEEIEKHLPLATLERMKSLDADDRQAFESSLDWRNSGGPNQAAIRIPEDGHAFLAMGEGGENATEAHLSDSVVTGLDAVLRFSIHGSAPVPFEVMVWMRYEEGEWRIRELDPGFRYRICFDDPDFVERFRNRAQKANESSATQTLYAMHFAIQRYSQMFPEVGIPDNLTVLAEPVSAGGNEDTDPETTTFLDSHLARNDLENGGYRFHYEVLRGGVVGRYVITARPVEFGKSGRFGYVIGESGDLRTVEEDREVTAEDLGPVENSQ